MEERVREGLARFFSDFLRVLGEEGGVEIRDEAGTAYVNLQGRFQNLPQEDGEFRAALARLAILYLKANLQRAPSVEVDINRQEEERRRKLMARALAVAEQARQQKRQVELEPMAPKDRRLIHLALADFPGVRTFSVGKGEDRRVVIAPAPEPTEP